MKHIISDWGELKVLEIELWPHNSIHCIWCGGVLISTGSFYAIGKAIGKARELQYMDKWPDLYIFSWLVRHCLECRRNVYGPLLHSVTIWQYYTLLCSQCSQVSFAAFTADSSKAVARHCKQDTIRHCRHGRGGWKALKRQWLSNTIQELSPD